MGVCASDTVQDPNDMGRKHDKSLQKELDEEKGQVAKRHKLLLLGPGNSGKSTFFKQLCTIHGAGLPDSMVSLAKNNVYDCCILQTKALISLWHDNVAKQASSHHNNSSHKHNGMYQTHNLQGSAIAEMDNENKYDDYDDDDDNYENKNNDSNFNNNSARMRKLSKTGKKNDYSNVPDDEYQSDDDTKNNSNNKNKNTNNVSNNPNNDNNDTNNSTNKNGYQKNVRQTSETLEALPIDIANENENKNENNNNSNNNNSNNNQNSNTMNNTNNNNNNNNNTQSPKSVGTAGTQSTRNSEVPENGRATSVNSSGITDDLFDYTIDDRETLDAISFIENDLVIVSAARFEVNSEIAKYIKQIWSHKAMKRAFEDRNNLSVVDSASYFFDNIDRISKTDYTPTEQDVLLVRNASTGIVEQHFWIEGNLFYVYDVGGQRSERKKWIQCFDSVDAVLFVASLSCYDQNLFEESDRNAMHETIRLFDEVVNSRYFRNTSMIIFFNKADLFRERIKRKPLSVCFPDYAGEEGSFESGIEYIRSVFANCNKVPRRELYSHVTTATDKSNVTRVFNDVQHSVVLHALRRNGIL